MTMSDPVRDALECGDLRGALGSFAARVHDPETSREIVLLRSRLARVEKRRRAAELTDEAASVEENRIAAALLTLLDSVVVRAPEPPPPPTDTWDVFLVHAMADKVVVREVARRLRAGGATVFLDEDSLPLGEAWSLAIPRAMGASRLVVVAVSPRPVVSPYVLDEVSRTIDAARRGQVRVIPLFLDGLPPEMPYGLGAIQGIDLGWVGMEGTIARLLAEVGRGRSGLG
jgi:hypothetical protein